MPRHFEVIRAGAVALAIALAGCSEQKLGGDVDVNGRKTAVTACRVGQSGAEKWVEVSTNSGLRIRVVHRPAPGGGSNTETVVQLAQPNDASPAAAQCRSKSTTSSNINGRISGSVTLGDCRAAGMVVSGKFTYGQCTQSGGQQI